MSKFYFIQALLQQFSATGNKTFRVLIGITTHPDVFDTIETLEERNVPC